LQAGEAQAAARREKTQQQNSLSRQTQPRGQEQLQPLTTTTLLQRLAFVVHRYIIATME
jgi:hypothetical protein